MAADVQHQVGSLLSFSFFFLLTGMRSSCPWLLRRTPEQAASLPRLPKQERKGGGCERRRRESVRRRRREDRSRGGLASCPCSSPSLSPSLSLSLEQASASVDNSCLSSLSRALNLLSKSIPRSLLSLCWSCWLFIATLAPSITCLLLSLLSSFHSLSVVLSSLLAFDSPDTSICFICSSTCLRPASCEQLNERKIEIRQSFAIQSETISSLANCS